MKIDQPKNPTMPLDRPDREVAAETEKPDCAKAVGSGMERDELIRQTAHSYYVARNQVAGHELQDWLKAESAVNQMPGKVE
jgi:hypothetical protein